MANTFSQIYIQTVFAVESRQSLITTDFKEDLHKYITGIVRNKRQKLIAINGVPDHLHLLIGLRPAMALADLVREIKVDSTNFINGHKFVRGRFKWAGRVRRVLIWPFTARQDHSLHSESGTTSS